MDESLILDSPAFKNYCLGVKLKHNSWASICGSDLIKDKGGIFAYARTDSKECHRVLAICLKTEQL